MSKKSPKNNSTQMELNIPMSSREVSLVSPLVSQANKKEQETIDISGLKCFESSKLSNQNSLLAKMSKALLTSKTAWSSRLCALTWKVKDTKFKRSIFQLAGVGAPHRRERIWILATNVAYTVSDDEREAITRSYEKARSLQEEYRKNYGSSGFFSGTSAIRNGDRGYEDVANPNAGCSDGTNEEVCSRGQTSDLSSTRGRDEDVENSRRTLQQRTFVQGENENEIRKGDANQSERPSGSSRYDVADSESSLGDEFQADTRTSESETQEVFGDGSSIPRESSWWEFEPNVGRVAYGVSGRVHRLKGLGNSIVPQIAEEIGKAIIEVYGSRLNPNKKLFVKRSIN
jgi:site-specific DNA-cytosine methylase